MAATVCKIRTVRRNIHSNPESAPVCFATNSARKQSLQAEQYLWWWGGRSSESCLWNKIPYARVIVRCVRCYLVVVVFSRIVAQRAFVAVASSMPAGRPRSFDRLAASVVTRGLRKTLLGSGTKKLGYRRGNEVNLYIFIFIHHNGRNTNKQEEKIT